MQPLKHTCHSCSSNRYTYLGCNLDPNKCLQGNRCLNNLDLRIEDLFLVSLCTKCELRIQGDPDGYKLQDQHLWVVPYLATACSNLRSACSMRGYGYYADVPKHRPPTQSGPLYFPLDTTQNVEQNFLLMPPSLNRKPVKRHSVEPAAAYIEIPVIVVSCPYSK